MFKIKTILTYRRVAAATKRDQANAVRAELRDLGLFWHREYLPLHFESHAYLRYGAAYTPRSARYNRAKGHSRPMVYSGTMMRQALQRSETIPSTKRVRVVLKDLQAVNRWSGSRPGPNFRDELTAVAPDELQRFAVRLDTGIARRLAAVPTVITKQTA